MAKSKEDVKRELREAREKAKKKAKSIRSKSGGSSGGKHPSVINVARDLEDSKTYYIVLLDLVPMIGAEHWFSADTDVSQDGKVFTIPRNCCANLDAEETFGSNPEVCPACWLWQYESEYHSAHGKLPEEYIPVDQYKGTPKKAPSLLIYYRAMIGEPKEIERVIERADGTEEVKKTTKVTWWDDPVTLQVKPSMNTLFIEKLEDIEIYDGDIRAYVWSFRKKPGGGMDKYSDTKPLVHNNEIVDTPDWILEQRDDLIKQLPSEKELLSPTPVDEMAKLLNIPNFTALKEGKVVEDEPVNSPVSDDSDDLDLGGGEDDSPPEDEVSEDDLDLDDDLPF